MPPEKKSKNPTRLLLLMAIVLLLLVLALQLRQIFGGKSQQPSQVQNAGVSPGKTAMIEDVRSLNESLSFDDLSALSAGELEQLYNAGAPGLPIGMSAAAYAAEAYAGTLEMDSITSDVDPDLDETPAHYDVELHHLSLGDFKYKVDAYTGQVLEGRANLFSTVPDANAPEGSTDYTSTPASGSQAQPEANGFIGEEAAKAAALTHAGIAESDAAGLHVELDWDDRGYQVYKVEFTSGGKEYGYDIDAVTGAVRKAEQAWDSAHSVSPSENRFIGEAAAISAALTHAGISQDDAGYIHWKLDQDGGVWLYKVEFRSGGVEYEYEIDAASGAVLKAEQDR